MAKFSGSSLTQAAINPYKHAQSDDSFIGGGSGGKKGGQAPMPPDYVGAAREQGRQNIDLARTNAQLSNPDITNPYGRRDVRFGEDTMSASQRAALTPKPTMEDEWARYDAAHQARWGSGVPRTAETQGHVDAAMAQRMSDWQKQNNVNPNAVSVVDTLNPQQQQMFDTQQGMIGRGLDRVNESFSKPFAFGGADDLQAKAEQAYMSRMQPQLDRSREAKRTDLSVQGIDPYGKAANKEYERLGFQENDARSQAILKAFGMRPQMLQEELAIRSLPMNELSSLVNGTQMQIPQFQNYSGVNAQPAPYMEGVQSQGLADMNLYSAGQQQRAGTQAGLFGLGAAALPYLMTAFSDKRLKSNIERVGTHPLGIGVYEYDIFGKRERGVMADEVLTVKPEAVTEHESGYLMVDYGRLQCH